MSGSVPPRLRCKGRCASSPAQVLVKHARSRGDRLCLRHRGMEAGAGACRHLFGKSGGGNARTVGPARRRGGTGRSGSGAGTAGVTAATFHSAALHQLNSVWADICEAPFPHAIEDQRDVVSRAIIRATARTDADPLTVRDVLAEINWAKISLVAVEDYARACAIAHRQPPAGLDTARFADVYSAYEQEKDLAWRNRF